MRGSVAGGATAPVVPSSLVLIGGFGLEVDGAPVDTPLAVQRLLAFLALAGRPLPRCYVAGSLWPETAEDRAAANLRATVWRLGASREAVVVVTGLEVGLTGGLAVDYPEALAGARRVLEPGATAAPGEVDRLLRWGELLPGWHDDWVLTERERLRQLRLHALEAVSRRLAADGEAMRAIDVALSAVAAEPLRESAHRVLVEAHLAEGNRAEAARAVASFTQSLRRCVGLEPSPRLLGLVDA